MECRLEDRVKELKHLWDIDFRVKFILWTSNLRGSLFLVVNYETTKDLELSKPDSTALQFVAYDIFIVIWNLFIYMLLLFYCS